MRLRVELEQEIIEYIETFGETFSEAVNRILDAFEHSEVPLTGYKTYPVRTKEVRRYVDVTNYTYIELINICGRRSNALSLKRILSAFYWEELAFILGIEPVKVRKNRALDKAIKACNNAISNVMAINEYLHSAETDDILTSLKTVLKELEGEQI